MAFFIFFVSFDAVTVKKVKKRVLESNKPTKLVESRNQVKIDEDESSTLNKTFT